MSSIWCTHCQRDFGLAVDGACPSCGRPLDGTPPTAASPPTKPTPTTALLGPALGLTVAAVALSGVPTGAWLSTYGSLPGPALSALVSLLLLSVAVVSKREFQWIFLLAPVPLVFCLVGLQHVIAFPGRQFMGEMWPTVIAQVARDTAIAVLLTTSVLLAVGVAGLFRRVRDPATLAALAVGAFGGAVWFVLASMHKLMADLSRALLSKTVVVMDDVSGIVAGALVWGIVASIVVAAVTFVIVRRRPSAVSLVGVAGVGGVIVVGAVVAATVGSLVPAPSQLPALPLLLAIDGAWVAPRALLQGKEVVAVNDGGNGTLLPASATFGALRALPCQSPVRSRSATWDIAGAATPRFVVDDSALGIFTRVAGHLRYAVASLPCVGSGFQPATMVRLGAFPSAPVIREKANLRIIDASAAPSAALAWRAALATSRPPVVIAVSDDVPVADLLGLASDGRRTTDPLRIWSQAMPSDAEIAALPEPAPEPPPPPEEPPPPPPPPPRPPAMTTAKVELTLLRIGEDHSTESTTRILEVEKSNKLTKAVAERLVRAALPRLARCLDDKNGRQLEREPNEVSVRLGWLPEEPSWAQEKPPWFSYAINGADKAGPCFERVITSLRIPRGEPWGELYFVLLERHEVPTR
ncbi:MAG: hypothetical protein Q8O67_23615 [Deltaproteobacteria bacterium]|nr:hypothetical protein [Deltaproteobacteria bacterium]